MKMLLSGRTLDDSQKDETDSVPSLNIEKLKRKGMKAIAPISSTVKNLFTPTTNISNLSNISNISNLSNLSNLSRVVNDGYNYPESFSDNLMESKMLILININMIRISDKFKKFKMFCNLF